MKILHIFYNGSLSASTDFVMDSGGNIGIGTTNPTALLEY